MWCFVYLSGLFFFQVVCVLNSPDWFIADPDWATYPDQFIAGRTGPSILIACVLLSLTGPSTLNVPLLSRTGPSTLTSSFAEPNLVVNVTDRVVITWTERESHDSKLAKKSKLQILKTGVLKQKIIGLEERRCGARVQSTHLVCDWEWVGKLYTVITEVFVHVKISYSGVRRLSCATVKEEIFVGNLIS